MSAAPNRERGVALVLVVVMSTVLVMLGIGALALAGLESASARSALTARQASLAAGSALDLVKHWFDAPAGAARAWLVPDPAGVERGLRRVDPDGDGTSMPFASAPAPWNVVYRQGRNDLFERPFTGGPALAFEGDASGPDVLIADDASEASVRAFLTRLNEAAFPSGPGPALALRVRRIAIYSPPRVRVAGVLRPVGLATVEVTASVIRLAGGSEEVLSSAKASGVLQEIPYARRGPLETAGAIESGDRIDLRWGETRTGAGASFGADPRASTAGGWPWRSLERRLVRDADGDGTVDDADGDGTADLDEWLALSDTTLADPWFRLLVGGVIAWAAAGTQPYPFDPSAIPGPYTTDDDRSGLFQGLGGSTARAPDAPLLRVAAREGGTAAHLLRYVAGSSPPLFREGTSAAASFEEVTRGRQGLFYFDTADGLPPRDDNGDGTADNLTPPIVMADPRWWSSGCIVVNASTLALPASERSLHDSISPPGEPFDDADADGTCGDGETFLEIAYPPDPLEPGAAFERRAARACGAGLGPLPAGPPADAPLTYEGLLLTSGRVEGGAGARIFGAVAAGSGIAGPPGGARLELLFDARLAASQWPPPASGLPRTVWQRRAVEP